MEIIWPFGGDRAEKRTVVAGTGCRRGQRRWRRGGNGDKIVEMGTKYFTVSISSPLQMSKNIYLFKN